VTVTLPGLTDFTASENVYQMNAALGESVIFTSNVPTALTETLTIQSVANGATVRTLLNNVSRSAGTYQDTWNGMNDAGQPVGDGPYKYVVVVTANGSSFTWDDTTHYIGTMDTQFPYLKCRNASNVLVSCNDAGIMFDPHTNKPLRLAYCVGGGDPTDNPPCTGSGNVPAIVIGKAVGTTETDATCRGTDCFLNQYQTSGLHELPWYGGSVDGTFLGSATGLTIIRRNVAWPRDTILLYGSAPLISSFALSAPVFNPASAPGVLSHGEAISMTVTSPASRSITVTAQFRNTVSNSILRTITTPSQASGSTVEIDWDGRADDGSWVTPDLYEIIVTATDSAGSVTTLKPLVFIRYE
jgi:flagellar hook assembly protein FlgD